LASQANTDVRNLETGQSMERETAGGQDYRAPQPLGKQP